MDALMAQMSQIGLNQTTSASSTGLDYSAGGPAGSDVMSALSQQNQAQ